MTTTTPESQAKVDDPSTKAPSGRCAAFYDVDGTLIRTNVVHAYAYYAVNHPELLKRVGKTASLLASLPFYWMADKVDRKLFNDAFYRNYAGFSEDRLVVLGQEIFEKIIRPNILPGVRSLVDNSKRRGIHQVLVTGALDVVTTPLADYLGVDDVLANQLEIKDGVATGQLKKPMLAGANKALIIRRYAEQHGLDLDGCFAYADSGSDIPMLSVVGHPVATNPDWKMKTTARAFNWPVLSLDKPT